MKAWVTWIIAKDSMTNEEKIFSGPNIEAPSQRLAQEYCNNNGLGYCRVDGELVAEIPCDENYKPDINKTEDFETAQSN